MTVNQNNTMADDDIETPPLSGKDTKFQRLVNLRAI